jgi:hypothetical protein
MPREQTKSALHLTVIVLKTTGRLVDPAGVFVFQKAMIGMKTREAESRYTNA